MLPNAHNQCFPKQEDTSKLALKNPHSKSPLKGSTKLFLSSSDPFTLLLGTCQVMPSHHLKSFTGCPGVTISPSKPAGYIVYPYKYIYIYHIHICIYYTYMYMYILYIYVYATYKHQPPGLGHCPNAVPTEGHIVAELQIKLGNVPSPRKKW